MLNHKQKIYALVTVLSFITSFAESTVEPKYFLKVIEKGYTDIVMSDSSGHFRKGSNISKETLLN